MNKKTRYYLFFTFLISWVGWGSLLVLSRAGLLKFGQPMFMIPFILAGFGPTIAPFIAIGITEGKAGFKNYRKRLFRFKVSLWYYLFPILSLIFLGLVSALVNNNLHQRLGSVAQNAPLLIFGIFVQSFFFGGLEELGWRGLLQHELQKNYQIGLVYLIVWVTWALWHLPLFFIPGVSQFGQNFWVFTIYALFFSLIFGWVYGRTKSIPMAVVGHTLVNTLSSVGYLTFLDRGFIRLPTFLITFLVLLGCHVVLPIRDLFEA